MKIGLDTAPAALRETYFQHLASVLARYAPLVLRLIRARADAKIEEMYQ